ncbi:hypothetical protein O6H91_06G014300 [Diphasiastrum complanatum]|uniref:Uncharacterized protein n=1 Tax=Diphasiastrum complanatum TaxID=34168 RepID=A0ACC2DAT0_DIPCM|nr:hypothetical protein O6H91_06G014300 [Diphasiastrum complanatum]
MSNSDQQEGSGGYKPWWAVDKEAWRERFAIVYKLGSISQNRDKPLPPWTEKDVQEFINTDPEYGHQLKLIRQAAKAAALGGVLGGFTSAAICYRYSRSSHGAILGFVAGAAVGWALTEEGANLALGLYKYNSNMDANLKFLQWWQKKSEG